MDRYVLTGFFFASGIALGQAFPLTRAAASLLLVMGAGYVLVLAVRLHARHRREQDLIKRGRLDNLVTRLEATSRPRCEPTQTPAPATRSKPRDVVPQPLHLTARVSAR